MIKILISFFILLFFATKGFCVPTNSMSITPSATDGTVISAADENARNNEVSTKFNAHSHRDEGTLSSVNTLTIGDGLGTNKTYAADTDDASDPALRYNITEDTWEISNDGSTYNNLVSGNVMLDEDRDTRVTTEYTSDIDKVHSIISNTVQIVLEDGSLYPETDNDVDLGKADKLYKTVYTRRLNLLGPNQGDILFDNVTGFVRLVPGTAGQHLETGGAGANPSWADSGKVIQVVNTQTGAVDTGTTVFPYDDTIPAITEGDEYMTRAITPTSATNVLKIDVAIMAAASGATVISAGLFQDATTNALAAAAVHGTTGDHIRNLKFTHYMTAGTTSSTTFRVRAGSTGGTTTINGYNAGRIFGGVMASSITISEIEP